MATYNFADTILRSIQTQDELNMRKQQMNLEATKFNQQIAQQNRMYGLEELRLNATEQNYQRLQQQGEQTLGIKGDMATLAFQKAQQAMQDNFNKVHTDVNGLTPQQSALIPKGMITTNPYTGTKVVPSDVVKNINTGIQQEQYSKRTNIMAQNADTHSANAGNKGNNPKANVLDAPSKTLISKIEADYQETKGFNAQGNPSVQTASNMGTTSADVWGRIKYNTDKLIGRYPKLADRIGAIWQDVNAHKDPMQSSLKGVDLTTQESEVLDTYFKYRLSQTNK